MNDNPSHICSWCHLPSVIIWVHGHGQCSVCKINVDECCRGEETHPLTPSPNILNDNCKAKFISQPGNVKILLKNIWRDESRSTFNGEKEIEKSKDD